MSLVGTGSKHDTMRILQSLVFHGSRDAQHYFSAIGLLAPEPAGAMQQPHAAMAAHRSRKKVLALLRVLLPTLHCLRIRVVSVLNSPHH